MIQLTEKEAIELKKIAFTTCNDYEYKEVLNEKGYIKKSKLDEARAKISNIKLNIVESRIVDLYEEAIEEILENKNYV